MFTWLLLRHRPCPEVQEALEPGGRGGEAGELTFPKSAFGAPAWCAGWGQEGGVSAAGLVLVILKLWAACRVFFPQHPGAPREAWQRGAGHSQGAWAQEAGLRREMGPNLLGCVPGSPTESLSLCTFS